MLKRKKRIIRWSIVGVLILLFCFSIHKTPTVSKEDERYIQAFLQEWKITESPENIHSSFETEVAFLQQLQDSVVATVVHKRISPDVFGRVSYYYHNRKGECFDRAVLLEKMLQYFDFEFRHVFIYFNKSAKDTRFKDFFKGSTVSHAVTEAKTAKGWICMDTNSNSLGLTKDNDVLTTKEIEAASQSTSIVLKRPPTIGTSFWYHFPGANSIYGVYSRKDQFLRNYIGLPSVNLRMLLYNF